MVEAGVGAGAGMVGVGGVAWCVRVRMSTFQGSA